MVRKRRPKPEHLPAKLLAIRQALKASQSRMVTLLDLKISAGRISKYERGIREPNLIVLLRYARLVGVSVDILIDDSKELLV